MQGVGHEDVHVVLQMPGNEADAVPCERLLRIRPRHGLTPALLSIGGVCGTRCAVTATDPASADGCDARPVTKGSVLTHKGFRIIGEDIQLGGRITREEYGFGEGVFNQIPIDLPGVVDELV